MDFPILPDKAAILVPMLKSTVTKKILDAQILEKRLRVMVTSNPEATEVGISHKFLF